MSSNPVIIYHSDSGKLTFLFVLFLPQNLVHSSNDIKLASLKTIKYVSKTVAEVLDFDKVRLLLPEFTTLLRDRNTAVKATSELTLGFMLQLHKNDQLFDVSMLLSSHYT
jgi:hypothetical protein